MAEPLTWRVVEFVAGLLATIRVADGYYTDIGAGLVITSRAQQDVTGDKPFALVLATSINTNEESTGRSRSTLCGDMDLVVEFAVPVQYGDNPERLAHRARYDIVRVLSADLRGKAVGISELIVAGSLIEAAPQPGTNLIVAQISARATLSESLSPA